MPLASWGPSHQPAALLQLVVNDIRSPDTCTRACKQQSALLFESQIKKLITCTDWRALRMLKPAHACMSYKVDASADEAAFADRSGRADLGECALAARELVSWHSAGCLQEP